MDFTMSGKYFEKNLLTRKEAAEYLCISANTLAVWASNKRYDLKFIRMGRAVRYRLSDLDEFMEQRLSY